MISVIIIWTYILFTLLPIGYATLFFLYSKLNYRCADGELPINITTSLIAGMVVVSLYAEYYSLFDGLGGKANLLLLLFSIFLYFIFHKQIFALLYKTLRYLNTLTFIKTILLLGSVIIVIYFTSSGYFFYDTALYHAQAVHWLESYGVVPGIGNIQYRLGYNSSVLCFSALYSMRWLTGQSYHVCNGFMLLLTIFISLKNLFCGLSKERYMSCFCSIGSLICCSILIYNAVSLSTDIIPMVLVLCIVIEWANLIEKSELNVCPYALLCIVGVFTFTGKVSMAMIVLLSIMPAFVLIKEKRIKELLLYIGMGVFTLFPFLIRNIIISGWVLYPFAGIDLFHFDWKIGKNDLLQDAKNSMVYARGIDVPAWNVNKWIPIWWKENRWFDRSWMVGAILAIVYWIKQAIQYVITQNSNMRKWLLLEFTFFAGVVYWFFTAPVLRYSSSFVILFPIILIASSLDTRRFSIKRSYIDDLFLLGMVIAVVGGAIPDKDAFEYTERYRAENIKLINQVDYDIVEVEGIDVGGVIIYYPKSGDQAWYDAFPASSNKANVEKVEMRGNTIEEGFRKKSK